MVAVLVAIPPLTANIYIQNVAIMTFLLAILASGWNIIGGYAGYVSLGHSAFIGVGAYTAGILADALGRLAVPRRAARRRHGGARRARC